MPPSDLELLVHGVFMTVLLVAGSYSSPPLSLAVAEDGSLYMFALEDPWVGYTPWAYSPAAPR